MLRAGGSALAATVRYICPMGIFGRDKSALPSPDDALPGRTESVPVPETHFVNGAPMVGPFGDNTEQIMVGAGCFWGVERKFWEAPGIVSTSVGYSGGITPNATYQEVCSGLTGHNEVVLVVFDTTKTSYDQMLKVFWENHDPTQGMRQGNDIGTQYRSGIYTFNDEQQALAEASRDRFQKVLDEAGLGQITTEIRTAGPYYYAEDYHQQYLAKNPNGYCGVGGIGLSCPVGVVQSES